MSSWPKNGNEGDKRRPQPQRPFRIMAPLMNKLMMKVTGRIHKRRISEDGESSQSPKQPRKAPPPPAKPHHFSPGWNFPGLPPSLHLPKACDLLTQAPNTLSGSGFTSFRASSTFTRQDSTGTPSPPLADMAGEAGSSRKNPIDLTAADDSANTPYALSFSQGEILDPPLEFGEAMALTLNDFHNHLKHFRCKNPKCREPLRVGREQIDECVGQFVEKKRGQERSLLHSFLRCNKCRMLSCGGIQCLNFLKRADLDRMTSHRQEAQQIGWCCDAGRHFLILAVACGPPPPSITTSSTQKVAAKAPSTPKKLTKPSKRGYPSPQLPKGVGYEGLDPHEPFLPQSPKKKTGSRADEALQRYFLALSKLLPSHRDDPQSSSFDKIPHSATAEMLWRSPLLPRASEVLRRGSALDHMGCNHQLYTSLLEFLLAISRHPDVLWVLFEPRIMYPESQQLAAILFGSDAGMPGPSPCPLDTTQSLDELLRNMEKLCGYYVTQAERRQGELNDTDGVQSLSVARAIIASMNQLIAPRRLGNKLKTVDLPSATVSPPDQVPNVAIRSRAAKTDDDRRRERVAAWHREHSVMEVPDDKIMQGFYFQKDAQAALGAQNSAKGRMKSLVTQVAGLRTNLPQGVYVRHGISRPDVIKVLIVGPEGTPYENGLFEFDMFCDADFPKKPPKMHFRTTGGGRVSFNPNLYIDGKVCFSLLGTWQGPSWDPHKSTILQLLVSIQAMILNAEPWYNEPGREAYLDPERSHKFNQNIWGFTLQFATTYWLRSRLASPTPSSKGKRAAQKGLGPAKAPVPTSSAAQPPAPASLVAGQVAATIEYYATNPAPPAKAAYSVKGKALESSLPKPPPTDAQPGLASHDVSHFQIMKPKMPVTASGPQIGQKHTSAFDNQPPSTLPNSVPDGPPSNFQQWWLHKNELFGAKPLPSLINSSEHENHPGGPSMAATGVPEGLTFGAAVQMVQWTLQPALHLGELGSDSEDAEMWQHHAVKNFTQEKTDPPSEDDCVWGETLRAYFSMNGEFAYSRAQSSKYHTTKHAQHLEELRDALVDHGFIKSIK